MAELSSLDLSVLMEELGHISGGKIQKIYHEGKDLHISIFVKGRGTNMLVTGDGKFFTTSHSIKHKERPTGFCMFLRKRLSGQWIEKVYQVGFERIIVIETQDYKIHFELFRNGNTIITDRQDKIVSVMSVQVWKDRVLKAHEIYKMPQGSHDLKAIDKESFMDIAYSSEKNIVSFLARDMSLGGNYAEMVIDEAGLEPKTEISSIDKDRVGEIYERAIGLLVRDRAPHIILKEDKYYDFSLFMLPKYNDCKKRNFDTLNKACEEFYISMMELEEHKVSESKEKKKMGSLKHRLKMQEGAIKGLNSKIDECNRKAEAIYTNFSTLNSIVSQVNQAGMSKGWDFVEKKVKEKQVPKIRTIDTKHKRINVSLDDELEIYYDRPLNVSAEKYYAKAKKSKDKIPGLLRSIDETRKKMETDSPESKNKKIGIIKRTTKKKQWYDKFRNFRSSSGMLVLAGKDATTNEILVKKHTAPEDIIFHAEIAGSPFVVVKSGGETIEQATIDEAAQFAAVYSKAWRMKVGFVDVYWARPDQVSKDAPSGEYIQKGSFMVRGKKNWLKPELKLSFYLSDDMVVSAPEIAASRQTNKYVTIVPGYKKSKELAKNIITRIYSLSSKEEHELLKQIPIDEIQKHIPAGTGEILK